MTPNYKKLLIKLVNDLLDTSDWPYGGDIDGGSLEELLERNNVLVPTKVYESCGERCACAEIYDRVDFEQGVTCMKLAKLYAGRK